MDDKVVQFSNAGTSLLFSSSVQREELGKEIIFIFTRCQFSLASCQPVVRCISKWGVGGDTVIAVIIVLGPDGDLY